ncbi:CHAT domain-containing tetratricopeptide repeat protein [Geitlerinema sp. PCC 7407]|uniref:CHAT domain-containing tetratricopeptide repeat protein n=1 Tax=Geitlerinema sp. PCC 7407 TaxID=1173025 RepID=UPI00029FE2D1|nr:CHAT domain-containing tetratricopeptide repeat protein [Geitlerinema sp. PCC 7407]AFY64982.1 Tetratricopeptide TPR_1 repeat-containing protein [Geitlerinema sp. PCC 7407]
MVSRWLAGAAAIALGLGSVSHWSPGQAAPAPVTREITSQTFLDRGFVKFQAGQYAEAIADWQTALEMAQAEGDRPAQFQALAEMGFGYLMLQDYERSAQSSEDALAIARELQQPEAIASTLNNLGPAYYELGRFEAAIAGYQEALAIAQTLDSDAIRGRSLGNLANAYQATGRHREAIAAYRQRLTLAQAAQDSSRQILTWVAIARSHNALGEVEAAAQAYRQGLAIAESVPSPSEVSNLLEGLGALYFQHRRFREAIAVYEELSQHGQAHQDLGSQWSGLVNLGSNYLELSDYPTALGYAEQGLAIAQSAQNPEWQGFSLSLLGSLYSARGEVEQSLSAQQQAVALARQTQNAPELVSRLNRLSISHQMLGQLGQAKPPLEEALTLARQSQNRQQEGQTLGNLGLLYLSSGLYADALEAENQFLTIGRETGDRVAESNALNNLALIYLELGKDTLAVELLDQRLGIVREIGDRVGESQTLGNLGNAYQNLEDSAKAIDYQQQRLAIVEAIGDRRGQVETLANLGIVYFEQGDLDRAEATWQAALPLARATGYREAEGVLIDNLGNLYRQRSDHSRAIAAHQSALEISRATQNRGNEAAALRNLGWTYLQNQQISEAIAALQTSVDVLESLRPGLQDSDKVALLDRQSLTYDLLQRALLADRQPAEALVVAERGRARAFAELIAARLTDTTEADVQLAPLSQAEIQAVAQKRQATLVSYSIVQDVLAPTPRNGAPAISLLIGVVQPDGTVTLRQQNLDILRKRNLQIQDLVLQNRQLLGARGRGIGVEASNQPTRGQDLADLKTLHQLLIDPIADLLPTDPGDRVILIPQGSLFLVPFAALENAQGESLIERHTLITAPSIQVLTLTEQQRQKLTQQPQASQLVVGNPAMPTLPSLDGPAEALSPLPGAEEEARAIADLLDTTAWTGKRATESAIVPQMAEARLIHLATHGLLDDFTGLGIPGAIALAPDGRADGLLTASEILDLKLNADLVVLSACDTGQGLITGDGVIGLSRSLLSAGSASVLVSLWAVPDEPTAALMTEFYRQYRQNPDKAKALRQAMLVTQQEYPDPLDWAAFTLMGEAE